MLKIKSGIKALTLMLLGTGCVLFNSCNSDVEYIYTLPSSATITSFSLEENEKVLPNLDSVFFSIDLYSGTIFNADSLPYGTKITSLTPVISTENASKVEVSGYTSSGEEKNYNYLENTTDTLDFSRPVNISVVSNDGMTTSKYTVYVNVHKVPTDTLVWAKVEGGTLPTTLPSIDAQHTTMSPSHVFYCMTAGSGKYNIANTIDPSGKWQVCEADMSFTPDINTFTASSDALYVAGADGVLYTSTDNGLTWTSTGSRADFVIGAYGSRLISTYNNGTEWMISEYPSGTSYQAPADFPVTNTSNAVTIVFDMATSEQMLITGGRTALGKITPETWGYDGKNWAKISSYGMPKTAENMTLVPYFDIKTDSISWRVSKQTSVMLAMCGNFEDGTPNDTILMSQNFGLTWVKAPRNMQMPQNVISPRTHAQAFPYSQLASTQSPLSVKSRALVSRDILWETAFEHPSLTNMIKSRATTPITEWEVPFIYLFGGENQAGKTFDTIYRGVITSLKFKPLQ